MPTNTAAYLVGKQVKPPVVKAAPYTPPGVHEIVVKNHAVAINPVDWFKLFQQYTVMNDNMAASIPKFLSYENACVLPLTLSTAATGLFQKDCLALKYPSVPPKPNGEALSG